MSRMQESAKNSPKPAILPIVDWAGAGFEAPAKMPISPRGSDEPLPHADIVVMTWTSAEWSALDHVFVNGGTPRTSSDYEWKKDWHPYTRAVGDFRADKKSGALWGSFQLVSIKDRSGRPFRVLLFKSNSHLAHPPWIDGLSALVRLILEDTKADRIYSIGTAGGARTGQKLGDAIVTNAAMLDLQRPENSADRDNGAMFRCQTWFPATSLVDDVERKLLFRMSDVLTSDVLAEMFSELAAKHAGDPSFSGVELDDLVNDAIRPDKLAAPRVRPMKDAPLLTTDFYYIARGDDSEAYSFLEMDDAVIAREAAKMGVRYAFVRNVSDPIVRSRTSKDKPISDTIRGDWSALIYERFGFYTSHNGALATWATIAGEGEALYNPRRLTKAPSSQDPLEVRLVYEVRSCGSCSFFWPSEKNKQPYGPYTAYDFDTNAPYTAKAEAGSGPSRWAMGRTRPPSFPNGEVVDGCRKAPIMTIGINPNLTAFAPGQTGAAWAYPNFTSKNGTDAWAKYAFYYRYRSVYQERLDFDFARRYMLPEGAVYAPRRGKIVDATRPDDSPAFTIKVRYEGDAVDTEIQLPGKAGDFPYVVLFDHYSPHDTFEAGDLIAGRLAVPEGIKVEVMQQAQGYYMQFVPVLSQFESTVRAAGHADAKFSIGEDVCQLDMVACASPHWNKGFLGGSAESIATIVDNCVAKNAWAMKQFVQTRPAVLFLVSKSTWDMFRESFGAHVKRNPPLSTNPVDHDFTLLRETTDPASPAQLVLDVTIDGQRYQSTTRLVITPHFSYNDNFRPQWRMTQTDWQAFGRSYADCVAFMTPENGFTVVPGNPKYPNDYMAVELDYDRTASDASLAALERRFPDAKKALASYFYDPHRMMAAVLDELYASGAISYTAGATDKPGYLSRTQGSCHFCVNERWQLPLGCAYGKTKEAPPPPAFLEEVARRVVATGKPTTERK